MSDNEDSSTESESEEEQEEDEEEESVESTKPDKKEKEENPVKTPAKKTPTKKPTAKSPAASPKRTYIHYAQEAIIAMKDRTGSSAIAIQKYILANNPEVDPKKLKQHLNRTLKTGVANKRFVKIKASYKLHPNAKKKPKPKPKPKPKSKAKAKPVKKAPKKLTPAQIAAIKEKERLAAKEKERLERIRKRKFPMEDLALIAEDKELNVSVNLPSRPSLPMAYPSLPAACKSDSMGSGMLDDIFHIYHFFRGDVGWGRFPKQRQVVAPFSLSQWMECVKQVIDGTAKKSRMIPPLMSHLFVVSLQHLVPSKLQVGLTPASWSEILLLYMDAMERYFTTEASEESNVLPGLPIDIEYLLGVSDDRKQESQLEPPMSKESYFYLKGSLHKAHAKLLTLDPWMLGADELLTLLRALVDDLLADLPECSNEIDNRLSEIRELLAAKRAADAHVRKLTTMKNKEQNEEKEREASDEKATRSNTKLPTVSDSQIEAARRAQERANNAYEKASRTKRARTVKLGEDRNFNQFYHCCNDPERVYVMQKGKPIPSQVDFEVPTPEHFRTTWHSIDKRSTLESFIQSLDTRGIRESALKEPLEVARKTVFDDVKVLNDQKAILREKRELQRKFELAKMKCEVGRKSGRLAAQSEQEFSSLQAEIDSLEDTIKRGAEIPRPDIEVETGLLMLRNFDFQEAQDPRRRTTRRDARKQQEEEEEENPLPRLQCSLLWPTGSIDGTGLVGSVIWKLLALEKRTEKISKRENGDRKGWISNLETAAYSWDTQSFTADDDTSEPNEEKDDSTKSKRKSNTPESAHTTSQVLNMIKQPLLQLEKRIFEMSGLATAANDADEADDNMSTNPEEMEKEKLQVSWKKIVNRLKYLPAKAHSKIRQAVVEGIAAARKAQLPVVVAQLREALLQFHPDAAGTCKNEALEVLEKHGGYDDSEDDDDEDMEVDEEEEQPKEEANAQESEGGIASSLCAEAVILNSSLDGQEDASRVDWIAAVKKAKTISKMASLVTAFCVKASEKLEKIESETNALNDALQAWQKAAQRKKPSNDDIPEPSEVWANVTFTDEFCLAKVQDFPWWPAKVCVAKDEELAASLSELGRTLVSLVGESGGLRVVKKEQLVPFSETPPEDESLVNQSKEIKTQLDECMTMTRRIIRGKEKKRGRSSRKKAKSNADSEFKEEKKLAS